MAKDSANIIEIFSSIQGEGVYAGQRQVFVRFSGCNFNCRYCDTDSKARGYCKIYSDGDNFRVIKNPISSGQLAREIQKFNSDIHHSISFTGGEPLIHSEFLQNFFETSRPEMQIYLETNGTLPGELKSVVSYIDIAAMDIKPESSTGLSFPSGQHKDFIKILDSFDKNFFVKIVISTDIHKNEIEEVKDVLRTSKNPVPVVLQPVTEQKISREKILWIQEEFLKVTPDVRVIPQMHRYLGLQ